MGSKMCVVGGKNGKQHCVCYQGPSENPRQGDREREVETNLTVTGASEKTILRLESATLTSQELCQVISCYRYKSAVPN